MILRNNSKNEWLNYHNGSESVDIKANSTFEVSESLGRFVLRQLGCDEWITECENGIDEESEEVKDAVKEIEEAPMKRPEIMKALKEKEIKFSVSLKNTELLELLK